MRQLKASIIANKRIAQGCYRMRLRSSYLGRNAKPGQFIEVKCSDKNEPLLRRPLGVHRILDNGIDVLYEVVGKGTQLLSRRKNRELLDIIGPLGNGFTILRNTNDERRITPHHSLRLGAGQAILIAGGIGAAPLFALAEALVCQLTNLPANRLIVLIGACTKSHILCEKEFKKLGCKVIIATEDGSRGHKGLITDVLLYELNRQAGQPAGRQTIIYACGPVPMLKTVAQIAEKKQIPCQVSMEERMACGVGACLGCPVKVNQLAGLPVSRLKQANRQTGKQANYIYKMVCKDGPVFDAKEIAW